MKISVLSAALFMTTLVLKSQEWSYEKNENASDGKYKISRVMGTGNEFPYENPVLVVNVFGGDIKNPNIYLSDVPCACCDNSKILVKFDNDEKNYDLESTTNERKDVWFFRFQTELKVQYIPADKKYIYWNESLNTWIDYDSTKFVSPVKMFLNDIMTHSKMSVRLTSDCEQYDCEFSLSGSTEAINFLMKK